MADPSCQGTRLDDDTDVDEWLFAGPGPAAGDYFVDRSAGRVYVCLPNRRTFGIPFADQAAPPSGTVWGFEEHEDGSVSLHPSIHFSPGAGPPDEWHGFLERGVFRGV